MALHRDSLEVHLTGDDLRTIAGKDKEYRVLHRGDTKPLEYKQPSEEELREEAAWLVRQPHFAARAHGQEVRGVLSGCRVRVTMLTPMRRVRCGAAPCP